jgi:hypothetical protein
MVVVPERRWARRVRRVRDFSLGARGDHCRSGLRPWRGRRGIRSHVELPGVVDVEVDNDYVTVGHAEDG